MAQIYTFLLNLTISEIPFRIRNDISNLINRQSTPSPTDAVEQLGTLDAIYPGNSDTFDHKNVMPTTNQHNTSPSSVNLGISIESGQHDLVGISGNDDTQQQNTANNEGVTQFASKFINNIFTNSSDNISDQESAKKFFETVTAHENALVSKKDKQNEILPNIVENGVSNHTVQDESENTNISLNASINSQGTSTNNAESSVVPGNTSDPASPKSIALSINHNNEETKSVYSSVIPDSVETAHSNVFLFPKNQSTSQNYGDNSSTKDNRFKAQSKSSVDDTQNTDVVHLERPQVKESIIKSVTPTINAVPEPVVATETGTPVSSPVSSRSTLHAAQPFPAPANSPTANENDVSPIKHIGLRGTIYFYVNQDSSTPQLVSGEINHNFDVNDTKITCETNLPIQITHKIYGNLTPPFNANVTINGNLCIHGNIYNITDGTQKITVGNITHIPPRPDATFTIRDTDKQFVHKYFEYSGKIYVDDWSSDIHWHTYYNPENYKVSSFDFTKEKDTVDMFNIGNWALYQRKINMYIGEVTVMGNIRISPPPFNIDLKKNNVGGGLGNLSQRLQVKPFFNNSFSTKPDEWKNAKFIGNTQESQHSNSKKEYISTSKDITPKQNTDMDMPSITYRSPSKTNIQTTAVKSSTNSSKSRPASPIKLTKKSISIHSKDTDPTKSDSTSRRGSNASTAASTSSGLSNVTKQTNTQSNEKTKELIELKKNYQEWTKKSRDVDRLPYRNTYYNNSEFSKIIHPDLIDHLLFYHSLKPHTDLQNQFIDNIHNLKFDNSTRKSGISGKSDLYKQIEPFIDKMDEIKHTTTDQPAPQLIDLFKNEQNPPQSKSNNSNTNIPDQVKYTARTLHAKNMSEKRMLRKTFLDELVKLLLVPDKSTDSSVVNKTVVSKESNDYDYIIQISGTLHTSLGEGKIHHRFFLSSTKTDNGTNNGYTLTKITRDTTEVFPKHAEVTNVVDTKFSITGSWKVVPPQGTPPKVPDFLKNVDFKKHEIVLPFTYKKPTGQPEQTATIEIGRIHIYKKDDTDKLIISGLIEPFDSASPSVSTKSMNSDPLIYEFMSTMKIQVEVQDTVKDLPHFHFKGVVVDKKDKPVLSKVVTRKTRPNTAKGGGRRTRRFRKNLKT
jgi:hypothetical protein